MVRGHSRPLGIALLAVLTAMPVVRTLCAWDCGASPEPAEVTAEASGRSGHCAQPGPPEAETADLVAEGDCGSCDVLGSTLHATVRTEIASLATALPALRAWPGPRHDLSGFDVVRPSQRAISPPPPATYPLRI